MLRARIPPALRSDIAWPILTEHVDGYSWIADDLAGNGMRRLAREGVVAGECGGAAVPLPEQRTEVSPIN